MMRKINKKYNQIGRSMVEMLGVLAVAGILSIGGIAGYNRASRTLRLNNLKDDLSHIIANVRTTFLTQVNYHNISAENMIKVGIIPDHMIGSDGKSIVNRLGGSVTLDSAKTKDDNEGAFILIFNGIDSETCYSLVVEDWGNDMQTGFLGLAVSKTGEMTAQTTNLIDVDIETTETTFKSADLPMAFISQSHSACMCTERQSCSIAWKFM